MLFSLLTDSLPVSETAEAESCTEYDTTSRPELVLPSDQQKSVTGRAVISRHGYFIIENNYVAILHDCTKEI